MKVKELTKYLRTLKLPTVSWIKYIYYPNMYLVAVGWQGQQYKLCFQFWTAKQATQ